MTRTAARIVLLTALGIAVVEVPVAARAQGPDPGGAAPGADTPIDAGIDRSRYTAFIAFLRALYGLVAAEDGARFAEEKLGLAEGGLSEQPVSEARSILDEKRRALDDARRNLARQREKLTPDDRVDFAILNLADQLRHGEFYLNRFLAQQTFDLVRPWFRGYIGPVALSELEEKVACQLAIAHLGEALRAAGASRDALRRWEEAREKAWKIMTARVEQIVKKLQQTDLFQKGYNFMHAVYHRALAKGDHEQQRVGLAGGQPLGISFHGCPGADCPEVKRQQEQKPEGGGR